MRLTLREYMIIILLSCAFYADNNKDDTAKKADYEQAPEVVTTQPAVSNQVGSAIPEPAPVIVEPVTQPVITQPVVTEPTIDTLGVGTNNELAVFANEWSSIWKTMGYESAAISALTLALKQNDTLVSRGALTAVLERQSSELRKFQSMDVPQSLQSVMSPFLTQGLYAESTCQDFRNTVINPLFNFQNSGTYIKLAVKLKDYLSDMYQLYSYRNEVEATLYNLIPKDEMSSSSFSDFFSNFTSGNNSTSASMNHYILPDSGRLLLTDADVASLDAYELRLARNEIYARYGRTFLDAGLTEWFENQQWYQNTQPKYEPSVLII